PSYQRGLDAVRQEAQQATAKANETFQKLIPILEQFENNAKVRLLAALQLLSDPTIAGKIEDATALQHEAAQLEPVFSRLAQAFGPLQELRRQFTAFKAAFEAGNREERRNTRVEQAEARVNALLPELQKLVEELSEPLM